MDMVERINEVISERGLSNNAVEKQLGFGNGSIRRFSSSSPSIDKIKKLSNFLDVTIEYIIDGRKPDQKLDLSEEDVQVLDYVNLLTVKEKYMLIGELKERTKGRIEKTG